MPSAVPNEIDIQVTAIKGLPPEDVQHAREVVTRVLAHAPRPVLYAKVTLNVLPDPAVPRPNLVSLRIDLNGLPVNAYASAASMPEAVGLAGAHLRARMEHLTRHRQTRLKANRDTAATG